MVVFLKKYNKTEERKLQSVVCNCCGRQLKVEGGYLREECISVDHSFGYFSRRDGSRHHFDLCEDCYQKWIQTFRLPVEEDEEEELL